MVLVVPVEGWGGEDETGQQTLKDATNQTDAHLGESSGALLRRATLKSCHSIMKLPQLCLEQSH